MKIGYLVSRYPAISHTFIRREVAELRKRGLTIETFSVRRSPRRELLTEEDRREDRKTWSVLPVEAHRLVGAHLAAAATRPGAYLKTLAEALSQRSPGARSALWSLFYFAEAVVLARELQRRNVNHLHTHFANAGGEVGFLSAFFLGIPWSVTLHGTADFDNPVTLGRRIAKSRFACCVSHFGRAQALRATDPQHWDRVFVSRCGLELSHLPAPKTKPDSGRFRLLTVGRLSAEKAHTGLIQAFAAVRRAGLDAELVIVGEGPERPRILAEIAERGLKPWVKLLGALPPGRVFEEMSQADVFVLPSLMEGLPVVLVEAMAIGTAVVAPRLSGVPELVQDNVTGILFTPADFEELGEKIVLLLRDAQKKQQLEATAREHVAADFAIDRAVLPLYQRFCLNAEQPDRG